MKTHSEPLSRRRFIAAAATLAAAVPSVVRAAAADSDPIIDIHQHTTYRGRNAEQLIAHQRAMGITLTMLLPAGSLHGLAVGAGGNDSVVDLVRQHPREFRFFANEVTDLPDARREIEKYLRIGAIGIGEQKFGVACDSPYVAAIAELAQEYDVPVLMHFQHGTYNLGFERFYRVLERFPRVNFIGHAQTWWGHIDLNHNPEVLYPRGPVTSGGLTDRWLADYPNLYADMSAGSGHNAFLRDEDHARGFLERHQDKLLYGSDCADAIGGGPGCSGAQQIALVRRLAPSRAVERKILYGNSKRLFKL